MNMAVPFLRHFGQEPGHAGDGGMIARRGGHPRAVGRGLVPGLAGRLGLERGEELELCRLAGE